LILLGALRDLAVQGRVHVVYRYALPCVIAGQALAIYLFMGAPQAWVALLHLIFK